MNSKQKRSAKRSAEHHAKLRGERDGDANRGADADAEAGASFQQEVANAVAAEVAAAAKRARSPSPCVDAPLTDADERVQPSPAKKKGLRVGFLLSQLLLPLLGLI